MTPLPLQADALANHRPVIGATYSAAIGPRGCITVCSCMPARDYLAAGHRGGPDGWVAHLQGVVAALITQAAADALRGAADAEYAREGATMLVERLLARADALASGVVL